MLIIGSIFTGNDHVNWLRSITLIHCQESKVLLLASTDCLPSHPTTDGGVTSLLDVWGDIVMLLQIFIPLAMDQFYLASWRNVFK